MILFKLIHISHIHTKKFKIMDPTKFWKPSHKWTSTLFMFLYIHAHNSMVSANKVRPSCSRLSRVCELSLDLSYKMSMSYYPQGRGGIMLPVVAKPEGRLIAKDKHCATEKDTLIPQAGKSRTNYSTERTHLNVTHYHIFLYTFAAGYPKMIYLFLF